MNITYLTWGETPRSYGVFGSQVIQQFYETSKEMLDDNFYFISAVPIIHSGLLREKWNYSKEIQKIRENLNTISFIKIPIYSTQNFFNSTKTTFELMHGISHVHLKNTFKKIKPDIVHCRSYHAAWAALEVKNKYKFNYKIVFDGRGLWPEETALKHNFSDTSIDYLFLKNIEKKLLSQCDVSIAVSDTMYNYYKKTGAKRTERIYLSSSTHKLAPLNLKKNRNDNTITFCYVGALSDDAWHQPEQLLELYKHLRTTLKRIQLIIVTTSNHSKIQKYFHDIPESEITYTSTKSIDELKAVLDKSDFGIMSYFKPLTKREKLLGNMVLAVKTVEYLSSGLPIIVNKSCGGAALVAEKYKVGIAYDFDTFKELTEEKINSLLREEVRQKSINTAKDLFDYKTNAQRYSNLYFSLLAK